MEKNTDKRFINIATSARKVKVYDVSNKKLLQTFETMTAASEYTGVSRSLICLHIRRKGKCHKNKLGFTICFR